MSKPKQIHELVDSLEKERAEWESTARMLEDRNRSLTKDLERSRRMFEDGNRSLTEDLERSRLEVKSLKKTVAQLQKQLFESQMKNEEHVGAQMDNLIENELGGKVGSAMAVFPEEIWGMIFDKLTGPEDLKSCSKVCVKFQEMLKPLRTVFLFDDVVKIINSSKVQSYRDSSSTVPLAKCRRVCKAWKKAADNRFLETNPIFLDYSPKDTNLNPFIFSDSKSLWNNAEIRNLPDNQNPMISHYLVYNGNLANFFLDFSFLDFLRKFGQHVWFFKVDQGRGGYDYLNDLCSFVALMPNLKGLHLVKLNKSNSPVSDFFIFFDDLSSSKILFPTIPTMTDVSFEDCDKKFVEAILKVNPQIQQLNIDYDPYDGFESSSNFEFDCSNLGNLTELSLYCGGWTWALVQNVNCGLKKLTLKALDLSWNSLFVVLEEKFKNTLVELRLELSGAEYQGALRLDLPNLKILGLKIEHCSNTLDFVMNLLQLEHLRVDLTKMNDVSLDKITESGVKIHRRIYNLKYSNIWELLPNLKTVMARTDRRPEGPFPPLNPSNWQFCTRGQART